MNSSRQVGVVGLGLLGSAIADRLIGAGFPPTGFDIDEAVRAPFEQRGGCFVGSLAEIAMRCNPMVLAVYNTEQVEAVIENGILPAIGSSSGKIVLCASTCDPDRIAMLARHLEKHGLHLLETPISGTSEQVRQGDGVGLMGGDPNKLSEVADIIEAITPRHFHMGDVGNGGRAKLAINLILGLNRLALAEGLVFAECMGLDPQDFLAVARTSACYSQVMDTKGPKMVRGDFVPEGRARQTLKDVKLMLAQARQHGQQLPLAALNEDILEACVRLGEGDDDNSVVISEIRRRRDITKRPANR
jgi:3-hydroxyisobutyrate dehydrogenase-like beta-hydroxyacid dehydrogenase